MAMIENAARTEVNLFKNVNDVQMSILKLNITHYVSVIPWSEVTFTSFFN